jgi:hypothetical protein
MLIRFGRVRWAVAGAALSLALGAGGIAVASALPISSSAAGNAVVSLAPVRIMDTRSGIGGASAPIGPAAAYKLTVAGVAGVPADAAGVLLNVTAVNGTAASFLTIYPDGTPRPNASNLNWADGAAHPNLVSVSIGANGSIDLYNDAGQVDLLVDLAGYYKAPQTSASALTAEAIVESGHQWAPGPFAFNTTDIEIGTDVSHDTVAAPESFVIARAGVYRVDFQVTSECCEGTLALTLNGTPINPTASVGSGGPGGGGGGNHTVVVDVTTGASTLQLVYTGNNSLYAGYNGSGDHSFASITIQRIGDRS